MVLRSLAKAAATAALFALAPLAAHAQSATKPAPSPGLPMWVVRDADSTIYITGTIHQLRDGMLWRSEKLDAALAASKELWLELSEIADPQGLDEALHPVLEKYAAYEGTPLSELLTIEENAALHEALVTVGAPKRVMDNLDRMEPWYATYALGLNEFMGGDYKSANAIDDALARLAVAQGIPVKGMEAIGDQIALMDGASIGSQLADLRATLKAIPEHGLPMQRVSDLAYGSWINGETHMVEALVGMMYMAAVSGAMNTEGLLDDRNANWAIVIEDMLKGSGVSFIAVGAAHLVGPESLQQMLARRGIKSKRY